MSIDHYPDLRTLFHSPQPVPPAACIRDHKIAVHLENAFSQSSHDVTSCPHCDNSYRPLVQMQAWLEEAPYNPFNKSITFAQWIDRYARGLVTSRTTD
jgi:hypothetical protein